MSGYGGSAQSATSTITFNSVPAGATLLVFPCDSNGNATGFGVSDGDGAYNARGSIVQTVGDTSSQLFVRTGASAGTHSIAMTCTGDTIFSGIAFYYTGFGDVDNSFGAINQFSGTMTATANNGSSGAFTTTTANSILIGMCINLATTAQPGIGTSPQTFVSESNGSIASVNGYRLEDFVWSGTGSTNVAFQYASGSHATGIIGFALAPAGGGTNTTITPAQGSVNFSGDPQNVTPATNSVLTPFTARRRGLLVPRERTIFLPSLERAA